jgi:hypothetical protein
MRIKERLPWEYISMDSERRRTNEPLRVFVYHRMALMTSREFDANGHRGWQTMILLVTGHTSHESRRTHMTASRFYDGGAVAQRNFSWAKEAVSGKHHVQKLPVPFCLVTATTPQSSESRLWLEFCLEKEPQKLVVVHHSQNKGTIVKPIARVVH